jgi:HK97 family phage portal protein
MILDGLFQREEQRVRVITGAGIDQDATLKRVFGTGPETTAGVAVDEEEAMGNSAYYCGIRLLSWGVGMLPFGVYQRQANGDKEAQTSRPEYKVLHDQANPEMTSMTWREIGQIMRLQWGRSINWMERDGMGRLVRIWPLHTRDVQRDRKDGATVYDTRRCKDEDRFPRPPGMPNVLFRHEVIDVPNFDGRSVIGRAREEMGETIAAQQLGAGFLSGGSNYAFSVTHPGKLRPEARTNLRTQLEGVHGIRRRIPILDEGMKLEKYGMPLADAQFLESRQWFVTQIARWLDIPPHKLKDLLRATFSNIYEQRLEWLESLLPHLLGWDKEVTRKVFKSPRLFAAHNADGILQADIEKRFAAYREGINSSIATLNEPRKRENWNTLGPAGDVLLVPQNMHIVPTTDEAREFYADLGLATAAGEAGEDPDATQQQASDDAAEVETQQDTQTAPEKTLNGSQIVSASAIVIAVAEGAISRESGIGQLKVLLNLTNDQAEEVMATVGTDDFEQDKPEPPPIQPPPSPPGQEQEDGQDQKEPPEPPEPPDNTAAQDVAKRTLKDRLQFAVRREVGEIRRAASKKKNFVRWLDRFYSRGLERFEKTIEPAAEQCRALGIAVDAEQIAFDHCRTAHEAVLDLTGEVTADGLADRLAAETERWEIDIPAEILSTLEPEEKRDNDDRE